MNLRKSCIACADSFDMHISSFPMLFVMILCTI